MLQINETIQIDERELQWSYTTAQGPGGQNVNKVATRAILRWDVGASDALPEAVKSRFQKQQRTRITKEGELILSSQRYRDQERNRQDCLNKLQAMIERALTVPKPRKKTKPSKASKQRRLTTKKQRSELKASRRPPRSE